MKSNKKGIVTVNKCQVEIENERNLLELIRKAGIEIPTFCYHSELSIYGACRLCLVDIEGMGIQASCSIVPKDGMKIKTNTQEVREIRKIALELLLANHNVECPTCSKSSSCKLEALARQLGVEKVRFKSSEKNKPRDLSSVSLVRDPNKCILCGDCVRYCREIQGIGAIDFAGRGKDTRVCPAFNKNLADVECVYCGQCAAVCPVGAITVRSESEDVFAELDDSDKVVIAQIAPAVRVALGEKYGFTSGELATGKITAALKKMGFAKVFDTSFAADLTVIEESNEFLERIEKNENLPQFTSCCPSWVKYAEQYYPELLNKLSSCRSPQQMFGSLARKYLPDILQIKADKLVIVSIMPCTAKKYEARRPEFSIEGRPDVNYVLSTQEVIRMIDSTGLRFAELEPESLDLPFGFKTGAGILFGTSGGVTEAVLRYTVEKLGKKTLENVDFKMVRGRESLKTAVLKVGTRELKMAIVHGLKEAGKIAQQVRQGKCEFDLVEVMACPSGCVGGAGQPVNLETMAIAKRSKGLYEADKMLQLHKSQENPYIIEAYENILKSKSERHTLLHTRYQSRRRIFDDGIKLLGRSGEEKLTIKVCVGTNCFVKGSQQLLQLLVTWLKSESLEKLFEVRATFCFENCGKAPNVMVGDQLISECTFEKLKNVLSQHIKVMSAS
jgi:NADH-quinone oxidoreductase subunit G